MNLFIVAIFAVAALANAEKQDKRGAQEYSQPSLASYAKVQQALASAQQPQYSAQQYTQPQPQYQSQYAQQPQYYTQAQPQTYTAEAQPQYQQYQPQAYAPQPAKVGLSRPQFSLAGDVSSFAYSSPVVQYNNLGVLSQVLGKAGGQLAYQSAEPSGQKVAYQPAAAAYSSAAPVQYSSQTAGAATKLSLAPQPQQYISNPGYAPQAYTAQTIPQAAYAPAPQYYRAAPAKYASSGISYAPQ